MLFRPWLALLGLIPSLNALAEMSEFRLPPVTFTGEASFEVLRRETFLPSVQIPLDTAPGALLDSMGRYSLFPPQNYGYPAGASGLSLGGRSIEDTQVTTLGVPLNLPQGGGPDLSTFPGFLWSEALIGTSTGSAGFSPSAASGSIELVPWTRSRLTDGSGPDSRFTSSADRQLQTLSIGTRKDTIAMLAGVSTGMLRGPSGSLSYEFLRTSAHRSRFHILGSDLEGDIPGGGIKRSRRILPVLETRTLLGQDTALASTAFADLTDLYGNRSEQFGIENSLTSGPWLLSFSARHVHFRNEGEYRESPLHAGVSREFGQRGKMRIRAGVDAVRVEDTGIEPGGRLSVRWNTKGPLTPVFEVSSVAKMPTLSARRYVLDTGTYRYRGNPGLLPERVWSGVLAVDQVGSNFQSRWTLKSEYRTDAQINTSGQTVNTTVNAGSAMLFSAQADARFILSPAWTLRSGALLSWSRLDATGLAYPDLPPFGWNGGVEIGIGDEFKLETDARYLGDSTAFDGSAHPAYFLVDQQIRWFPSQDLELRAGVMNLFDERAEMVVGFPLPGRLIRASVSAGF
jgi:hypothetical protein